MANDQVRSGRVPGNGATKVEPKQTPAPVTEARTFERSFSKMKAIVSDVFKLVNAPVMKNLGIAKTYDEDPADFKEFAHEHIFRTFDTSGVRHTRCCATAGHFHEVDWDYDEAGNPVVKSVSGPKVLKSMKVKGQLQNVAVDANDYDHHTHKVNYLISQKVEARTTNIEATKIIAYEAQKTAAPESVIVK